jgi:hypothetical protein
VGSDVPRVTIRLGLAIATAGLIVAAATNGPYLSLDGVNAGTILLAAGLFAALFATPFALERALRDSEPDRDRRWERALLRWGAVAAGVLVVGLVLALGFGLHGRTFGGSVAIVLIADAALILGTLVAWMFSN